MNDWRKAACHTITAALKDVTTTDAAELRRILFDAYPFGERRYTPYRVWCEEVNAEIALRTGSRLRADGTMAAAERREAAKLAAWNQAAQGWKHD